ncbi:antibiotic biosynthesis monooxygenase family protein [Pseudalkalibacillus caeni]|uniref:Antibiotic biosynthesis monooxygenase n=1 Tax=Exobacillus caeni TaxID=2574798 RepID=A0A5R9EUS9_9BACL|nr:antibiotic biosynthesis monooxygenase [Pseudalkalibacillus caeni]TLS34952.1 antibiotic biosynthesis monooxygenase [Pseudalkalibacillus caeni]
MYIVNSIVNVPVEKAEEVIGIYQKRSKLVDDYKGFISFQLLQNEQKPEELTVHMQWESKQDYLNWVTSDAYKRVHDLEKNYPDQELASVKPKVQRFKVVAE